MSHPRRPPLASPNVGGAPSGAPGRVRIHYRRLPDRTRIFDQQVVLRREDVVVTLSEPVRLEAPMEIAGNVAMEHGSLALWFTFPGAWHDIGRFHRGDGTFTGFYANILTPPHMEGAVWHTTDLFLDLWLPPGGEALILDEDELDDALRKGDVEPGLAGRAREEAARLHGLAVSGRWPPPVVHEWTLERALAELGRARADR